jgi:hypothetical protein
MDIQAHEEGYPGIANDLETLRFALKCIADGEVMKGTWTHAETVAAYQRIAFVALKSLGSSE